MEKFKSAYVILVFLGMYSCNPQFERRDASISTIRLSEDGYSLSIGIPDLVSFKRTLKWEDYLIEPLDVQYLDKVDTARIKIIPRYWDGESESSISREMMGQSSTQRDSSILDFQRKFLLSMRNSHAEKAFWDTTFVHNEIGMAFITTVNTDAIVLVWNGKEDFLNLRFFDFKSREILTQIVKSLEYTEWKIQ
jgi:hypothetical protein